VLVAVHVIQQAGEPRVGTRLSLQHTEERRVLALWQRLRLKKEAAEVVLLGRYGIIFGVSFKEEVHPLVQGLLAE